MAALKTPSHSETFSNSNCQKSLGKKITYTYDSMNRRVARTDEKGTTQYLYGNPNHPFQLTAVRSPSGSLSRYHYDDFGLLFALERDNNWYYITTDQLGTPRVVCDANGELVKVLEYDSFGQVITDSNPEFELHISFAGGLIDVDTELVRFGFRDYDALAGKWTAKDPINFAGGDTNLYSYVFNSPVTWQDPLGLFRFCKRPLNGLLPFIGFGHSSFFDKHNIGLYHEYGRFEDGSTVGFDNKLGVTWREEPIGGFGYECEATLYDDDLMLQVINQTEGGRYSLLGSPTNKKNNCQDWAAKLRINYDSMSFNP